MTSIRDWLSDPTKGLVPNKRESQIVMAEAVEDIFTNGGIAFIEAGTGTGKSVAYGLPAALHEGRVVISTAKKALQEQLQGKDLPHIANTVRDTAYSLLKGKGNYLCALRAEEFFGGDHGSSITPSERLAVDRALDGTGETGSLNYPWLGNIRVSECVRMLCPHSENCGYVHAREAGKNAKILVVNHALLAHDLAFGGGKVLGPYDTLVIDEGHQAPGFFRDAFSLTLMPRQHELIQRLLKDTDFELSEEFSHLYHAIFAALGHKPGAFSLRDPLDVLFINLYTMCKKVHDAMVARGIVDAEGQADVPAPTAGLHVLAREYAKVRAGAVVLGKVKKLCSIVLNLQDEDEEEDPEAQQWVKYTEKRGKDETHLIVTPLEVGPLVAPALLGMRSVVVTSATLATATGMNYMAGEYGLTLGQIRTQMTLPSPFNYAARSALYISKTAPDPSTRGEDYYKKMCEEVHELLKASRGGAFVLCASTDDTVAIHDGLYRNFHPMPYKLGKQTSASPEAIIAWFKADPTSVLVGLKTFWEGVDIPGDALRLVIIPRLPFPARDVVLGARKQVFIDALMEKGKNEKEAGIRAWDAFDFQIAVLDVKQGGGRLIRTETDTGIVAILDRRAQGRAKAYSAKIRAALPHPQTEDKAMVLSVLDAFATKAGV